jgi:hypothetical protein
MAATEIAVQPNTFVALPVGVLAIKIPPKITTPDKLLLVLMRGLNKAGSVEE